MLTRHGFDVWGPATVAALGVAALGVAAGWWWLVVPAALFWFAVAAFFRDPPRPLPEGLAPGDMLSSSDGHVSAVLQVDEHEATGGPATIVRVFLSVLDVHVNRAPCAGTVVDVRHRRGHFYDARTEESAALNESLLMIMDVGGERIGVRQVVGKVARRIVNPSRPGDRFERGQRFGMIKFGSTTELILPRPDDVVVHVAVGQRVVGGRTVLATLAPAGAPRRAAPRTAGSAVGA